MAKNMKGREGEFEMLKNIPGIDPAELARQAAEQVGDVLPPAPPKPGEQPPPPPAPDKKDEERLNAHATGILKEIFGDQFTSVDDLKTKNIAGILKEVDALRQQNQTLTNEKNDLTGKLEKKPKNNFANDDVALFNEFVRETGIKSFDVFNRLNSTDLANMDDMNAIVLARFMENPALTSQEPYLRKHIEKMYNVDPEQVSEEELKVNKIGLSQEAIKARKALQELKGKLKIPENPPDLPPAEQKWTPEQEQKAQTVWNTANKAMVEHLATIPIFMPDQKEAFVNFAIPEETLNNIQGNALKFALSNQMEATEENIKVIANFMYSELVLGNLPKIVHSVFEKARSLSEVEARKLYHNPKPLGGDNPPANRTPGEKTTEELSDDIMKAEMGRR